VVPQLTADAAAGWRVLICTPGMDPFRNLAEQLVQLAPPGGALLDEVDALRTRLATADDGLATAVGAYTAADRRPIVLVIDQMEELFTLGTGSPEERQAEITRFVANLASVTHDPAGLVKVIATMRADFMASALAVAGLSELLQDNQVMLGPLVGEKRREVIVKPAAAVGALFEKGLVSTIMSDVDTQAGALPLLQHALHELWGDRQGPWLTIDAYERSGGVGGALATRADAVLAALPPAQQDLARQIFLRLTTLGDGVPDTRRRSARSELYPSGSDRAEVDAVLEAMLSKDARLVVVDGDSVEIAHEALLRSWPTLRGWLDEDRDALRVHRRLTERANEWANERNREMESLYEGSLLAEATAFATAHPGALNEVEQEFLSASEQHATNELEEARRYTRRLRFLLVAASIAFVLAAGAAVVAVLNQLEAERLADAANARALATVSEQQQARDPGLAALLALEAHDRDPTPDALQALHGAASTGWWTPLPTGPVTSTDFSPDGTRIVTASFDGAKVWDPVGGREVSVLETGSTTAARFSPDGIQILVTSVTVTGEASLVVRDAETSQQVVTLEGMIQPQLGDGIMLAGDPQARWSDDGLRVVGIDGEQVRIWDAATGASEVTLETGPGVMSVDLEPGGERVAVAADAGLELWDVADQRRIATFPSGPVSMVRWTPDGSSIVTAGEEGTSIWDPTITGAAVEVLPGASVTVAFSPDGTQIVTTTFAGTHLWDVSSGLSTATLPARRPSGAAPSIAPDFDDTGSRIVTADDLGTRIWTPHPDLLASPAIGVESIPYTAPELDASGGRALTYSPTGDGLNVYDVATGEVVSTIETADMMVLDFSLSGDGSRAVLIDQAGPRVFDATDGTEVARLDIATLGAVLSHDGSRVLVWGREDPRVVDVATGDTVAVLDDGEAGPGESARATFSVAGDRIVTTGARGSTLWDADDGKPLADLDGSTDAAFGPDGARIVTIGDEELAVWDRGGDKVLSLPKDGDVTVVGFSQDGRLLYAAGTSGTRIIDADTGVVLTTVPTGPVDMVGLDEEATHLTVTGPNGTQVWRVWGVEELQQELRERLGDRQLTDAECALVGVDC
jgi:WD40 repeat protein